MLINYFWPMIINFIHVVHNIEIKMSWDIIQINELSFFNITIEIKALLIKTRRR